MPCSGSPNTTRRPLRDSTTQYSTRRNGSAPVRFSAGLHRRLLPSYRFWSLPEFSYLLVYDPATDPVQILRCVHTSRDLPRELAALRGPLAP